MPLAVEDQTEQLRYTGGEVLLSLPDLGLKIARADMTPEQLIGAGFSDAELEGVSWGGLVDVPADIAGKEPDESDQWGTGLLGRKDFERAEPLDPPGPRWLVGAMSADAPDPLSGLPGEGAGQD